MSGSTTQIQWEMSAGIQEALDKLSSPRSSTDRKARALVELERIIATACLPESDGLAMHVFVALQYTFECNIPSHVIAWMALTTAHLDSLTTAGPLKSSASTDRYIAAHTINLSTALSLLQGIALSHDASKCFLGRRYSLEVLVDLLLASRRVAYTPAISQSTSTSESPLKADDPKEDKKTTLSVSLTATILDTLLCILVDSPTSLRNFEDVGGLQAVVKLLKRAGTARGVRMKCLEFLYFYLLDETTPPTSSSLPIPSTRGSEQSDDGGSSTTYVASATEPQASLDSDTEVEEHAMLNDVISVYGSSTFAFESEREAARTASNLTTPRSISTSSTGSFSSATTTIVSGTVSSWTSSDYSTSYSTVSSGSRSSSSSSVGTLKTTSLDTIQNPIPKTPAKRAGLNQTPSLPNSHFRSKSALSSSIVPSRSQPDSERVSDAVDAVVKSVQPPLAPRLILLRKDIDFKAASPAQAPASSRLKSSSLQQTPSSNHKQNKRDVDSPLPSLNNTPAPRKRLGIGLGYAGRGKAPVSGPPSTDEEDEDICQRLDNHLFSGKGGGGNDTALDRDFSGDISQGKFTNASLADNPHVAEHRKTAEQKKALLGTMLRDVDALVEGVRRAGVLGLG